jgi:hypothetical protein
MAYFNFEALIKMEDYKSVSLIETSSYTSAIFWDPPESGVITSEDFDLPMLNMETCYSFPKNSEVLRIWNECNLHETEFESRIIRRLYKWAVKRNVLWFHSQKNENYITWKSPSNVLYNTSWTTFIRWFLCACIGT